MGKPHESYLMVKTKSPPSFSARIPRAPEIEKSLFDFMPGGISLGPYDYWMLESYYNMKLIFRDELVSRDKKKLEILYDNLAGMVKELRGYYEENDTSGISDEEFTRMMLLDGCFILSFIKHRLRDYVIPGAPNFLEDIFLVENQIPYQVLNEVMKVVPDDMWEVKINRFLDSHPLVMKGVPDDMSESHSLVMDENDRIPASTIHLLELLQTRVTKIQGWSTQVGDLLASSCKVRDLRGLGIRVRPNRSGSLACVTFVKNWFFSSYLELPRIIIEQVRTERLFVNLVVLEMYYGDPWITMYLHLLDSLIDRDEDITILRDAGVLIYGPYDEYTVFKMLKAVRKYIKPCPLVKSVIHDHYDSRYDSKGSLKAKLE